MRENTDQNNSKYGHFSHSDTLRLIDETENATFQYLLQSMNLKAFMKITHTHCRLKYINQYIILAQQYLSVFSPNQRKYYVICAMRCVSFWSKSKANNVFPKHILKSKARYQWIRARKKLFCHVILKNYLSNSLCNFLIKIESTWRREIKVTTPQVTLLYYGRTARSIHRKCTIKKLLLKISQYPQEKPVL